MTDKAIEAAEKYRLKIVRDNRPAPSLPCGHAKTDFLAGVAWRDSQKGGDAYKKAAEEWMAEYDKLKEKYEPAFAEIPD